MVDENLADLDLAAVAAAIRDRQVTSVAVVEACLQRITDHQPRLNAFISVEAEAALDAAHGADGDLADGRLRGPLHGVPLAHKDMFYRAGMVSTFGSKICRDYVPSYTGTLMTRLDAAGAITVGALNMCEFAIGPTGHNGHFGHCRNPWNIDHISGGSSSGSGAAVAARVLHGSFGSDTGGSVRLPAGMCGVVGLKATYGVISRYGGMPRCWSLDVFGPLARTVMDAAILLDAVAGPDDNDPTTASAPVRDYVAPLAKEAADLRGLRVGVPVNVLLPEVEPGIRPTLDAALDDLRALGAEIVEVTLPDTKRLHALTNIVNKAEAAALHEPWVGERPQDYATSALSRVEAGFHIPATDYLDAIRLRPRILEEFAAAVFGSADVLFAPVLTGPVPTIAETDITQAGDAPRIVDSVTRCTRWVSYLGLPAMTLCGGFDGTGLPISFQLIGRAFDEPTLLRVGHAYQGATDWHRRAPQMEDTS